MTDRSTTPQRPLPRPKRWRTRWASRSLGNLALLATSCVLSLLLAEVLIRTLQPQQPILLRPDIWQPHDGLGVVHAPDLNTTVNTGERQVRLRTDGDGHRVGIKPLPEPAVRILALGDSYLAALQVDYEQTLAAIAEQRLTDSLRTPVRIVNAGVGGWGPSHYLLKARRELARQRYDQVVVFLYLGNDLYGARLEHFAPQQPTATAFRWPRRLSRQEIVYGLLYPLNQSLEQHSHLFLLTKNRLWFLWMRLGLSARYLPPALLKAYADDGSAEATGEICQAIATEAWGAGSEILFVLLPGVCEVDREIAAITAHAAGFDVEEIDPDQPSRRMSRELMQRGLPMLDATPTLRAALGEGRADLYGRVDPHFDVGGHQVVADLLVPRLLASLSTDPTGASTSSSPLLEQHLED